MNPRLLVINFANKYDENKCVKIFSDLAEALKESSRYHGYKDPSTPAFLNYSIWRYVDLGDPNGTPGKDNPLTIPMKKNVGPNDMNCDYGGFFSEKFAKLIGVRDPNNRDRFLRLDELIDKGFVHEVWVTSACDGVWKCLECVELKQQYDDNFKVVPGKIVQSGNGGDDDQKWTGRSVRINLLNNTRGIGCGMENLGHSMEGMAHGGAIPYYKKYFYQYGMFDLNSNPDYKASGYPHDSFYPLWGNGQGISYPDPNTAIATDGKSKWTFKNFVAKGGNVHFPPNGRSQYDQANAEPVMSTIEDWRIGSGPGGKDIAKPWTNAVLKQYEKLAPDCMGKWLVYWRQNMPGYKNLSKDDNGKPMKNWFVFLFY